MNKTINATVKICVDGLYCAAGVQQCPFLNISDLRCDLYKPTILFDMRVKKWRRSHQCKMTNGYGD